MLRKDTLPPGFDPVKFDWELEEKHGKSKFAENYRFAALYEVSKGTFGARAGNPWRLSRRKWIERYVKVKPKVGPIQPLVLNHVQRRLEAEVLRMERAGVPVRIVILKARQMGCSTYVAALAWWYVCTRQYGRAGIICQDTDLSEDVVKRMRVMHREMRKETGELWGLVTTRDNAGELTVGEPLYGEVLIDSAQVKEPGRGKTFQVLHMSEAPIWPDADRKADAVVQTLPEERDTYGFNEATANGDFGWFPSEFRTAWRDNRMGKKVRFGWRGFFAPWFWDQRYRWSVLTGKPPDAELELEITSSLTAEERVLLGQRYIVRGRGWVTVDIDQLAWRRYWIKNKVRGSLDAFHQEYPATPEEAFLSSGMPFFEPALIGRQRELGVRPPEFVGVLIDEAAEALLSLRPKPVGPAEGTPEPVGFAD